MRFADVSGGPGVSVVRTDGSRIGVPTAPAAGANAHAAASAHHNVARRVTVSA